MAYQVEDHNGNQPANIRIWEEAIDAFEKDKTSFEFEGSMVAITGANRTGTTTKITIHMEE
ncbi:hypothetical protein PF327_10705 [Sulfurovum sp. XTW-4]|uniref:Uncharacterized protein n=1 Tax=Sulfurovum xiamenensis TaxID=3019066 RepID=A0ABT7QVT8_9BACT|nr:hypothetical protein [Sulfurovum xiamenensis]MDM5264664.1 hypothetical protein [Sulfurovum xiamenensis]